MNKVAIVVPAYKTKLNSFEKISLKQMKRVLGKYPIVMVIPESLVLIDDLENTGFGIERFPDEFFSGIESYSRLCLSDVFYNRFSDYEYILIYQLDAFVFEDKLDEFCNMAYDYLGAPEPVRLWPYLKNRVGCGGFSLRRVSACRRILESKDDIFLRMRNEYPQEIVSKALYLEDCFWAYCGQQEDLNFRVPDLDEALRFSVEMNVNNVFEKMEKHLPFGVHKWYAENFDVWWPIIKKYGYQVSDDDVRKYAHCGAEHERWIRCEELAEGDKMPELRSFIWDKVKSDVVRIYGHGDMGKSAIKVLNVLGFTVQAVYDSGVNRYNQSGCTPVSEENINTYDSPILICCKGAGLVIENNLSKMIRNKTKCFQWMDIEKEIVNSFVD